MARPDVCFSLGMGVDSVALALLWMHDPATRPCPLDRILFVSAMTGDEWPITGTMMADHALPLFREHHIRYAQIARAGMSDRDGIAVLDDSRDPGQMYLRGPVSLSQEMVRAGTVPQVGGHRKCSLKWKGWPLDQFLAREMADSYVQVMGYEAGERKRADKDTKEGNSARRTGRYPLIGMGWDRLACQEYIRAQLGVTWPKSACVYCPFALTNEEGRERVLDRYATDPHAGLPALMMEHIARTLNPRQGLAGSERGTSGVAAAKNLIGLLKADPRQQVLLRMHSERLHEVPWKLFEVQRAYSAPGQAPRQLRALATGTRAEMTAALRAEAAGTTMELTAHDGIERAWRLHRAPGYPAAEWLLAAAPAGPVDKTGRGFTAAWERALATSARALW
jgi:hypothetical protein